MLLDELFPLRKADKVEWEHILNLKENFQM